MSRAANKRIKTPTNGTPSSGDWNRARVLRANGQYEDSNKGFAAAQEKRTLRAEGQSPAGQGTGAIVFSNRPTGWITKAAPTGRNHVEHYGTLN